jgi:UDP-glucose-4-epimerase GalE
MTCVLVTGGAGYIGSHTCKALARAGFEPVTVDNLTAGHRWAVRWGPLAQLDVRDTEGLVGVLAAYQPVGVLHFAASIDVAQSLRTPLAYYQNNVVGLLSLLDAMTRTETRLCVFSSTAAVYGEPDRVPIPETAPLRPQNPYGTSKLTGERVLADVAATGSLSYVALRYFNAAGADPDGEIDKAHEPETHLVPNAIRAATGHGAPLTINGSDFPTADGTAVRDYVHVTDLADAHVRALEQLLAGAASDTFNVGTGAGASVMDVVAACTRVLGTSPAHTLGPRRAGDPARLVAAGDRIRSVLGWQPLNSSLDQIVATAARWHASA